MIKTTLLLIFVIGSFSKTLLNNTCIIQTPDGNVFDLTPLIRTDSYYEVRDPNQDSSFFRLAYGNQIFSIRVFNICGNHPRRCQNSEGAYEVLSVLGQLTDSCEVIGKPSNKKIHLIDQADPHKGVRVVYQEGSICDQSDYEEEVGKERNAFFDIYCSENQDQNFKIISEAGHGRCNLGFQIHSPSGCRLQIQQQFNIFEFAKEYQGTIILILVIAVLIQIGLKVYKNKDILSQLFKEKTPDKSQFQQINQQGDEEKQEAESNPIQDQKEKSS